VGKIVIKRVILLLHRLLVGLALLYILFTANSTLALQTNGDASDSAPKKILDHAVNLHGVAETKSVNTHNGEIIFSGSSATIVGKPTTSGNR
jgi:hypothetical protein